MAKKKSAVPIKRPFWWRKKEKTFTTEQVAELLDLVKEFNAGCIDAYLSKHVDRVFKEWLQDK